MSTLGDRIFHRRKAVFLKFNVGRRALDVGRLFGYCMEISTPDFDLSMTLDSGQVFHWERAGNGFAGTIGDLPVYMEGRGNILRAEAGSASSRYSGKRAQDAHAIITHYLALDHPLAKICRSFPDDPVMNAARQFCRGLRIIRQPKWECLATFICSSMKQV